MKQVTRILAALVISVIASGCTMNRAASLRMLDERAGYAIGDLPVDASLKGEGVDGFRNAPVPVRSRPRVAAIWIHPHETASHDYFWGGWMSVVVEKDQWILNRPGRMPRARAFVDITPLLHPKRMATKVRTSGFRKKD